MIPDFATYTLRVVGKVCVGHLYERGLWIICVLIFYGAIELVIGMRFVLLLCLTSFNRIQRGTKPDYKKGSIFGSGSPRVTRSGLLFTSIYKYNNQGISCFLLELSKETKRRNPETVISISPRLCSRSECPSLLLIFARVSISIRISITILHALSSPNGNDSADGF